MKKVLAVDDNQMNLRMLELVLKNVYDIALADSGEKALAYLEENGAELVLLDILMPGMDGFETLKKMREKESLSKIPVIFLTADIDEEVERQSREAGAIGLIEKPFKKDVLIAKVEEYLAAAD